MKKYFTKLSLFIILLSSVIAIMAFKIETKKTKTFLPPDSCGNPVSTVEKIVCLTTDFKALLTSSQIAALEIAWTTTAQARWSNLPGGVDKRNGIEFGTLSEAQITAANAIIAAAAGTTIDDGFSEFSQTRLADAYLGANGGGGTYSSGEYIIAFLGTPSLTGKWMLQFGGHHYAQNISFNDGKVIGTTPSHQGLEPLSFVTGGTTYSPLKSEHAGMLAMLASLSTSELTTAKLSTTFSDVALGPGKDGKFPTTKLGLKCSNLSVAQKALIVNAMKPWLNDCDDASGAALLATYTSELDETYISYSGNPTLAKNADYVRIDGPSVWMELVCQSGVVLSGIHYHCIYRDHTRDYGASGNLTAVKEVFGAVSETHFSMGDVFPNPATSASIITYNLTSAGNVKVTLLDMMGREVANIFNENNAAGKHSIQLGNQVNNLQNGIYICRMEVENKVGKFLQTKKINVQ